MLPSTNYSIYVSRRKQAVDGGEESSKSTAITSEGSQGFKLGTTFFLIFINDIPFLDHCYINLFTENAR